MSKIKRLKIRLADGSTYSGKVTTGTVEDALAKLRQKYARDQAVQAVTFTLRDGGSWTIRTAH